LIKVVTTIKCISDAAGSSRRGAPAPRAATSPARGFSNTLPIQNVHAAKLLCRGAWTNGAQNAAQADDRYITAAAITSELRALSFTPVDGVPNTSVTTTFTLSDTSSAYGVDTYDLPLTLANFTGANGANPLSDLVVDAAGDLFGTTESGGAGNGTVFEIAKSTGALTTLASFTGANGDDPWGVTSDAAGDLFGTTADGGADGHGTVFEIAASTGELTTLATFTGANGAFPFGTVISDAAGDLFGTTTLGGADGGGTVFEIAKSTGELTTLATFTGANGATPTGRLAIDAEGDLFGTTETGGANGDGTVFEIAKSTGALTTLATSPAAVVHCRSAV
jgi:uncharacterized repeat protein (TIGR03803 family)